jgi:hypothetical protein
MKYVTRVGEDGQKFRVMVKNDDPAEFADYGIPAGPPDLDLLDWDSLKRQINDVMIKEKLFGWEDVQGSGVGLVAAVNVFKRALIALYRDKK